MRTGLARLPWEALGHALDVDGFAVTPEPLLTPTECADLVAGFDDDTAFRSTIDMARHRFGEGTYRYYASPLPPVIASLREHAYPSLATVANRWAAMLGRDAAFPATHAALIDRCHSAGQTRPTPLILRYATGGWNALHQDIYGDIVFPLQLTVSLSRPGVDFDGGEMLFVEQRPRAQSRGTAVTPELGHAVIFSTRERPVAGTRGVHRTIMRHGVSRITRGNRLTLGVIFHDAT